MKQPTPPAKAPHLPALTCLTLALTACAPTPDEPSGSDTFSPCGTPVETGAPVTSMQEAVDRINELPRPVTIPCFISTLPRPLSLNAANSIFSAQPAVGDRSPRFFIYSDPLIISIAPEGDGAALLEMSELVGDGESVKAELKFPIEDVVSETDAYEQVMFDEVRTNCAFCHANEKPAFGFPDGAFVSRVLRPRVIDEVPLDFLSNEAAECDGEMEPSRCEMLRALFNGPVEAYSFPEEFDTFF